MNESVKANRKKVVEIAKAIQTGSMEPIQGCRQICRIQHDLGDGVEGLFRRIVGIESDTDLFPLDHDRAEFNKEYLAELDAQRRRYVESIMPELRTICQAIIEELDADE